jgi:hypothetical protein
MTQVLQLLSVIAVGVGLALYARIQDRREHADSRQTSISFPSPVVEAHHDELVTR